jgi:hypothetical protein
LFIHGLRVLVLWRLWEKLGLHQLLQEFYHKSLVEFPVEEAIFGMVLNRLVDADSKLGTYDWLKEKVFRPEFEGLELHHLYRALDFLEERIKTVEKALFVTERELFNLEVDLVFFDTTSTYDITVFRYAVADLLRTELPGRAYDAFQAVGLRPPPRLQSLTTSS